LEGQRRLGLMHDFREPLVFSYIFIVVVDHLKAFFAKPVYLDIRMIMSKPGKLLLLSCLQLLAGKHWHYIRDRGSMGELRHLNQRSALLPCEIGVIHTDDLRGRLDSLYQRGSEDPLYRIFVVKVKVTMKDRLPDIIF